MDLFSKTERIDGRTLFAPRSLGWMIGLLVMWQSLDWLLENVSVSGGEFIWNNGVMETVSEISRAGFVILMLVAAGRGVTVLPDWVLADVIGTLRFPDTGGPRVDDTISLSMALMWVPPLFMALALAGLRPARSGLFAGAIFLGAETLAPVLELWEPVGDTTRVLGVAVYVLPPEVALGWAAAVAFTATRRRSWGLRAAAALAVSTFYLGALVLSYFVIDVAEWRVTW